VGNIQQRLQQLIALFVAMLPVKALVNVNLQPPFNKKKEQDTARSAFTTLFDTVHDVTEDDFRLLISQWRFQDVCDLASVLDGFQPKKSFSFTELHDTLQFMNAPRSQGERKVKVPFNHRTDAWRRRCEMDWKTWQRSPTKQQENRKATKVQHQKKKRAEEQGQNKRQKKDASTISGEYHSLIQVGLTKLGLEWPCVQMLPTTYV
jgi:hypothetical protein